MRRSAKMVISIALCVMLMASLLPTAAMADNYIEEARFVVEAPYGGYEVSYDAATEDLPTICGYWVNNFDSEAEGIYNGVRWKDLDTKKLMRPGDKFVSGHDYEIRIYAMQYYADTPFGIMQYIMGYSYLTTFYLNGSMASGKPDHTHPNLPKKYAMLVYTFEDIEDAPAPIDFVEVYGVNAPVTGASPDNLAGIGTGNYKLCSDFYVYNPGGVAWLNENGVYLSNGTFEDGKEYTVSVMLEAVHPYRFKSSGDKTAVSATLNGQDANTRNFSGYSYPADRYCLVEYTFPACRSAVSFVEVEIDAPKLGAYPDYTPTLGYGYSVFEGTVWWYKDGDFMAAGEKFESGHNYSIQIWLKADKGFAVDGNFKTLVSGTLNGATAKIGTAYEQEASQVIALSYDFGKAGNHSLSYVPMVDSTCTDAGKLAYYKCSCGEYYEDAAGTKRITNFETWGVIPALGHCPTEIIPDGDEHWAKCSRCKEEIPGTREAHFGGNEQADGSYICEWCGAGYGGSELKPIAYIALGIEEPVAGAEANFVAVDRSSGAEGAVGYDFYSPTPVKWYDKTDGKYLAAGDRFIGGHVYRIDVYLYAEDGYTIPQYEGQPSVLAYLNWLDTKVMSIYGLDSTKYIALSHEFAPLEGESYVFPFADVAESAWYYQWIKGAHQMGLINGKTATTYCPKDNMTYAEAIKLAACMHQLYHEGVVTLENGKPDWRISYYDYCLEKGIIRATANAMEPGYNELFALASQPIDRETYVYIFSRALPAVAFKEINNIPDNSIPDVPVTQGIWDDGIYLFYRAGILNGTDAKGTFNPTGNIQRSEVAAILNRMMDESVRVGPPAELGK